jgi:hypothetical protein
MEMEQRCAALKRPFIIFAAVALAAILGFAGLSRVGIIDVKKPVTSIPGGIVPHGGAEKPPSEQMAGGAR